MAAKFGLKIILTKKELILVLLCLPVQINQLIN
jgi:hypothetical protein